MKDILIAFSLAGALLGLVGISGSIDSLHKRITILERAPREVGVVAYFYTLNKDGTWDRVRAKELELVCKAPGACSVWIPSVKEGK